MKKEIRIHIHRDGAVVFATMFVNGQRTAWEAGRNADEAQGKLMHSTQGILGITIEDPDMETGQPAGRMPHQLDHLLFR